MTPEAKVHFLYCFHQNAGTTFQVLKEVLLRRQIEAGGLLGDVRAAALAQGEFEEYLALAFPNGRGDLRREGAKRQ